jgi:nucleoside-diphosphate-sugar epimerase
VKVLVTGAMGYVGSYLVPHLLGAGHKVVAYDLGWFGDGYLSRDNDSLKMVFADIRDLPRLREELKGVDAVIHLACVSNDHSCQLDEALSTSINYDAFEPLVVAAKEAGVRRFIYCSSSSVYGVSNAADVREDHPLVPLTLYNRYKGMCEPLLFKHQSEDFECVTIRPATVCGPAPRMRFDLTVNILTAHAALNGAMTVFGGRQRRPNLHMKDMVRCYKTLLTAPSELIQGQTFNVGRQNMAVGDIAELVREIVFYEMGVKASIQWQESTDTRSYHVNSDKIRDLLGFVAEHSVADAARDICVQFKSGLWKDGLENPNFTNVKQLVDLGYKVKDSLASYRKDRYASA